MALSSENVVFVYRSGDGASLDIANRYQAIHGLADEQLVGVPCSDVDILNDEDEFNTQVLTPLTTALATSPLSNRTIWVIILGFTVPGGFVEGADIISASSRISRINHTFSKKTENYLYNRQIFARYDGDDADFALITARMDGPNSATVINMMNQGDQLSKQVIVNGKFYIDPYSDRAGPDADRYTDDLVGFLNSTLGSLNLDVFTTQFIDPYFDSVLPSVEGDSFVWSWFTDRTTSSFFKVTNTKRAFFYNADYNAAGLVRSTTEGRWVPLAISAGYSGLAGAMSNPTIDGFLRPKPFFEALRRGATIGEAYIFSVPHVDWTLTFFGDPLVTFDFPKPDAVAEDETKIGEDEMWRLISGDFARSVAYMNVRSDAVSNVRNTVISSTDVATAVDMMSRVNDLIGHNNSERITALFNPFAGAFFRFPVNFFKTESITSLFKTLDEYLTDREFKVSVLLKNLNEAFADISSVNVLDEGFWDLEFTISDEAVAFTNYHFQIDISTESDFSDITVTANSLSSQEGWMVEEDDDEFIDMPAGGVQSGFVGKIVRYISQDDEYLVRGQEYYVRYRQRDSSGIWYDYTSLNDIVYT